MSEAVMGLNVILVVLAMSFGVRTWALTSVVVLFELG